MSRLSCTLQDWRWVIIKKATEDGVKEDRFLGGLRIGVVVADVKSSARAITN